MAVVKRLRLGTRGSQLALWQAHRTADALAAATTTPCEIVRIRTSGDRRGREPLASTSGKADFVKEIEDALLAGTIDVGVHSAKDLAASPPAGLSLGAVLERRDPRDALVLRDAPTGSLEDVLTRLGGTPRIGTGSPRRRAQVLRLVPDARVEPVRGNVDTRLAQLDQGRYDALILAVAGLERLGRDDRVTARLPLDRCIPAPGQGTIALQVRKGSDAVTLVEAVDHPADRLTLEAEWSIVRHLGAGCRTPLGAIAWIDADSGGVPTMVVVAAAYSEDGRTIVDARAEGVPADAARLGRQVADALLAGGAGPLIEPSPTNRAGQV